MDVVEDSWEESVLNRTRNDDKYLSGRQSLFRRKTRTETIKENNILQIFERRAMVCISYLMSFFSHT